MKQNLYFLPKVKWRTAAQIHNMTRTVCANPYTVGLAVKKPKALLHDPHDVSRLIKRCHTLRSQFADELNQDILFQGWLICAGGGSALVTDIRDKDNAVSAHMRQMQTRCSSYSYLISCSVFFLCSFFLCILTSASLAVRPTPLAYLGTSVMASKGKVRGEWWLLLLLFPLCLKLNLTNQYQKRDLTFYLKKLMDGYFSLFASILLCACVSVLLFPDYFENSHICVFGWNVFFVFFISDFYYRVLP